MKLVHMLSGLAISVALVGCAQDKNADVSVPAPNPNLAGAKPQNAIKMPSVSGSVWIRQRVALPQKAFRTEGKQSPCPLFPAV